MNEPHVMDEYIACLWGFAVGIRFLKFKIVDKPTQNRTQSENTSRTKPMSNYQRYARKMAGLTEKLS